MPSASTTPQPTRATGQTGDRSPFAIGLLLRKAHDRAAGALVGALRPLGLELRHFAVLIELTNRGPQSQKALVDACGSDKASMVRVVDDLERKGLVERRPVPGDRRMHSVALTPAGVDIFDRAHVLAEPIADLLATRLAPGEADQLLDLLTRFSYPETAG